MPIKAFERLIIWVVVVAVLLSAISLGSAQAQGAFFAGAAKAKITPQSPVWLAGYDPNRRSAAVHDDLWARALVLKAGDQLLALASVDLIGFPNIYLQRVREMVKGVPADAIIVSATHNHSGPDLIGLWGPTPGESGVDKAYLDSVIRTVAQVIEQAAADTKPATVKYAAGDLAKASKNIRIKEILDTELAALQAVGEDGKPVATLVNFACHPAIMNNDNVTADFCNWTYQRIEGKGGGLALFVNGAQGGMITADVDDIPEQSKGNWDDAARIGNAIADRALEVLSSAQPVADASITLRGGELRVPVGNPTFEAAFEAGVLPDVREEGKIKTEIMAGSIGRAEFVTIPGEAFPNLDLLLKRWMTGDVKFVFGITQDELGYIMSREDYGLKLYEYEASMSVGPETGRLLVDALLPLIEAVNPKSAAASGEASALDAWFFALPDRFNAAAAGNLKAIFYFDVTGEGGGDYTINVVDGKCAVEKRKPERADLKGTISASDATLVATGKLDPVAAWSMGKLVFDGDMPLAMLMVQIFGF